VLSEILSLFKENNIRAIVLLTNLKGKNCPWPELARIEAAMRQKGMLKESTTINEAMLDISQYGGWISPQRKVEYVETFDHAHHMRSEHGLSFMEAILAGWVRFTCDDNAMSLSVEGLLDSIRKTYRAWAPTALGMQNLYVDIMQWRDSMGKQGLKPHMVFYPKDGDKTDIIDTFGPSSRGEFAEGDRPDIEHGNTRSYKESVLRDLAQRLKKTKQGSDRTVFLLSSGDPSVRDQYYGNVLLPRIVKHDFPDHFSLEYMDMLDDLLTTIRQHPIPLDEEDARMVALAGFGK
jgi:hypothetical protein